MFSGLWSSCAYHYARIKDGSTDIYEATLALYLAAALSNSSLFSAKSTRNWWLGSAFFRDLQTS